MNAGKCVLKLILQATLMGIICVEGASAGPPDSTYELVFEDEFEGDQLNRDDWGYRLGPRSHYSYNRAENVRIADGKLHIDYKRQDCQGYSYTGGGIISNHLFGYGYYEVKSKVWGDGVGLHSSFWQMGLDNGSHDHQHLIDAKLWPRCNWVIEIDGYEIDSSHPTIIHPNYHYKIGGKFVRPNKPYTEIDASKEYFIAGYEFLPNQINYYYNGNLAGTVRNPEYSAAQPVWLTALAGYANSKSGPIDDKDLPGVSSWEYFRLYVRDMVGVNIISNPGYEFNQNIRPSFNPEAAVDKQYPICWIEDGDEEASLVELSENAYQGDAILTHKSKDAYAVRTFQRLEYIPNARYRLHTMIRSSGEQTEARMSVSGYGGEERHVDVPQSCDWMKIVIDGIHVTNNHCVVMFSSQADGGQWMKIDAVALVQQTGQHVAGEFDPLPPLESNEPWVIMVDNDTRGYSSAGNWSPSVLQGYHEGNSTRCISAFHAMKQDAYAKWTPELYLDGTYRVSLYKVQHQNTDARMQIEVVYEVGTSKREINGQTGQSQWVDLGTYPFRKGRHGYVKLTSSGDGYLRADAVKFELISPVNPHTDSLNPTK